jgi:WD40 repeat protein
LDICLSPLQTKVVCGMSDNKCLIVDIGREKAKSVPTLCRKFSHHVYGVNSVSWHPFKSLILSSSLDISDSIKLWDPYS